MDQAPAVYAVALPKGGSTKTTTAAELAAQLATAGRRTVAIDLDRQGNLTTRLGIGRDAAPNAVAAEVLTQSATVDEAAMESPTVPGVWVVAGTSDLSEIEQQPDMVTGLSVLIPTLTSWDAVVVDTPPAQGVLTLAALAAADQVVASASVDAESYDQLRELERLVERVSRRLRAGQRIDWIVPTKYNRRRLLDTEVLTEMTARYGDRVTSPVREAVAVRDAYVSGMPIGLYAPDSPVAQDYVRALEPIIRATTEGE